MEELLPLLIGIIWIAYTWYNKVQKKKQGKNNQPVSAKREPSILEQLITGETVQFSEPEPVYEENEEYETISPDTDSYQNFQEADLETEKEKTSAFLTSELSGFTEEGQSVFEDTYNNGYDQVLDEDTELVFDTLGEMKDFDLRKAVILSEILNAPYIDYK